MLKNLWDRHGLWVMEIAISALFLPVEGEFYVSLMNSSLRPVAYLFCLMLDIAAGRLMYDFARVQREGGGSFRNWKKSPKKWRLSWIILLFVVANAVASWGATVQQLHTQFPHAPLWLHSLNAAIQPVMLLGIAYTQAIQESKFATQTESKDEQPKVRRIQGQPDHEWWLNKVTQMDGQRAQMTPQLVNELILKEYTLSMSPTTLYNWSKEAQQFVQEVA